MATVLVTILRRDESDLTAEERISILAAFPGKNIIFQRTDPKDYLEHAAQCRLLKPDAVVLPREKPIPALAMEEGFRHITILPDQGIVELEGLMPKFKPFQHE